MDKAEALLQAVKDEASNLGCGGSELGVFLSDMLDRITERAAQLTED